MKAVVTVIGKDRTGIIARVSGYLADNDINILDISQTIVDDFFNIDFCHKCTPLFSLLYDA